MKRKKINSNKKSIMLILYISAAAFFAFGSLSYWAHKYTSGVIRSELAAQKIYFPEKGSSALDPAVYPDLQKYAGQLVDSPQKAKAYANGYLGRHLSKIAGGKTYAEVSAEAMNDPGNQELQKQKQSLFQGETLRSILLTSGYGFGTLGMVLGYVSYVMIAFSGLLILIAFMLRSKD